MQWMIDSPQVKHVRDAETCAVSLGVSYNYVWRRLRLWE
jgi:hypothetical protein